MLRVMGLNPRASVYIFELKNLIILVVAVNKNMRGRSRLFCTCTKTAKLWEFVAYVPPHVHVPAKSKGIYRVSFMGIKSMAMFIRCRT